MMAFIFRLARAWNRAPIYGWRRRFARLVANGVMWLWRFFVARPLAAFFGFFATHPVVFLLLALLGGLAVTGWTHREQVIWVVKKEYERAAVVVRPFEVPESLVKQGYTGAVLVERLLDEIQKIRDEQNSKVLSIDILAWNNRRADDLDKFRSTMDNQSINIPAMDTDFLQTMRFIRQIRGDEIITLAGEAHCPSSADCKPDDMRLTLRLLKSNAEQAPSSDDEIGIFTASILRLLPAEKRRYLLQAFEPGDKGLSATLRGGAMAVLEVIDPLLFAAQVYLKQDFQNDQRRRADVAVETADKNPFVKRASKSEYNNESSTFVFTKWLFYLDKPKEALPFADRVGKAADAGFEAVKLRGDINNKLKDFIGALADYDRAISIKPDEAGVYFAKGNTLYSLARKEEALANYDTAIKISPKYANAYNNRGNTLYDLGRKEDALASYDKAIEIDPKHAGAHFNRGTVNAYLNNLSNAQRDLLSVTKLNPTLSYPALYAHLLGKRLGQTDDAALRAAMNNWTNTDWPKRLAAYSLGEIDENELFDAVANTGHVENLAGRLCEAHFFVGYQALITGDAAKARNQFLQVIATGKTSFIEYDWAKAELARLGPAPESATAAGWWSYLDYAQWAWTQAAAALYPWADNLPPPQSRPPNPSLESGGARP